MTINYLSLYDFIVKKGILILDEDVLDIYTDWVSNFHGLVNIDGHYLNDIYHQYLHDWVDYIIPIQNKKNIEMYDALFTLSRSSAKFISQYMINYVDEEDLEELTYKLFQIEFYYYNGIYKVNFIFSEIGLGYDKIEYEIEMSQNDFIKFLERFSLDFTNEDLGEEFENFSKDYNKTTNRRKRVNRPRK
jgi:hypothetical protein